MLIGSGMCRRAAQSNWGKKGCQGRSEWGHVEQTPGQWGGWGCTVCVCDGGCATAFFTQQFGSSLPMWSQLNNATVDSHCRVKKHWGQACSAQFFHSLCSLSLCFQPGKQKKKFSSFFKSLVIELDKELYGPDNHLVEVESHVSVAKQTRDIVKNLNAQNWFIPQQSFDFFFNSNI